MAKTKNAPSFQTTETGLKTLVRNALMMAGTEMGETGDHWPVIKNTINDIMKDWQNLETERAANKEVAKALYGELNDMEKILAKCTPDVQKQIAPRLAELRQTYDAAFTDPDMDVIDLSYVDEVFEDEAQKPIHIRRAENIISTLFDDIAEEKDYA